ncbi:MAG: hypothetical protein FWG30_11895 [Eubacteriaceae bacterium]|nr:hypothetical protein [Eubacteriaceae bacterium]
MHRLSIKMAIPTYDAYFEVIPAVGEAIGNQYHDLKCAVPEYAFLIHKLRIPEHQSDAL